MCRDLSQLNNRRYLKSREIAFQIRHRINGFGLMKGRVISVHCGVFLEPQTYTYLHQQQVASTTILFNNTIG